MFLGTFAWSFVYVSLPFHIERLSTLDAAATLHWTGWILGISSLVTVVTSPFWGRQAERGDPKRLYVRAQLLQGVAFFGTAAARTLPELFLARLALGCVGAVSTFAFVSVGRSGSAAEIRRQVAAVQSAMTIGHVIGPLAGALAAARFGFRASFVLGGLILWVTSALVAWGVPNPEPRPSVARERTPGVGAVAAVALVVLAASTQVFFLASVLPRVLSDLGVPEAQTLETGGLIMFASGLAAALGALAAPRLRDAVPETRLVALLLAASSGLVAALGATGSAWPFGLVRFLQVLCIAPVFPLAVAGVVQYAGGAAIGVVNASRVGAAFVGPVIATTLLAWTSPATVYLALAVLGLACVPFAPRTRAEP
jgi:MFS family permease